MVYRFLPILLLSCGAGDFSGRNTPDEVVLPPNGGLQVRFLDVGQGDGILIVTPKGETVLVDGGGSRCKNTVAALDALGIGGLDYTLVSHYHEDHIGCLPQILARHPLRTGAFDRGDAPLTDSTGSDCTKAYLSSVKGRRQPAIVGDSLELDGGEVRLTFVAVNGNGTLPGDENDLGVVAVLRYGRFDLVLGGDLGGYDDGGYDDLETIVAPAVGRVEAYKVHHHGSRYSSNATWLDTIRPRVGIVSAGTPNAYGHPDPQAVERLHDAGTELYWTGKGAGAKPVPGLDRVWGTIVIDVAEGGGSFTITGSGGTVEYESWAEP
jgi:beta-lactamase superfamily II metal-dependent hydrolase